MNSIKKALIVLLSLTLILCTFAIISFATPAEENSGAVFYFNGNKYQVFNTSISWDEAKVFCESLGGHLATITSPEEQALLEGFDGRFWLGGTDSGFEGVWTWITGEEWDYTNWFEDEPNNDYEREHYLSTWDGQKWNDLEIDSLEQGGFICEWENYNCAKFEELIGVYDGTYTATQGLTGLTLAIYRTEDLINDDALLQKYADIANLYATSSATPQEPLTADDVRAIIAAHNEDYIAIFNYFPVIDDNPDASFANSDVEEGLYTMTVGYNEATQKFSFTGKQWIQHDTYAMANLENISYLEGALWGDVFAEYESLFGKEYADFGDVYLSKSEDITGYRIDFEFNSTTLEKGDTQEIRAVIRDYSGNVVNDDLNIRWITKDGSVAKVVGENWSSQGAGYAVGTITAISKGETEIYAQIGNNRIAVCTVKVKETNTILGRKFNTGLDYYTAYWDSSLYDPTLVNMLAALSSAVYDRDEIEKAYESLGFTDLKIEGYNVFDPELCTYAIGHKDSDLNDEKICLVTFRGSTNVSDWIFNFDIATYDTKHVGFLVSALIVKNQLINEYGIRNDVKYVITGHSRGGAVANLLAVLLMEEGISPENIYAYTFASPDVACRITFPEYKNIFNLCNRPDPVPKLPGSLCSALTIPGTSWGKYGVTYYFTKTTLDIGALPSHAIKLYLEFFDQKLYPHEWGYDFSDAFWDLQRTATGLITKILCPVDVIVSDKNGEIVASVINGEINYYDSDFGEVIIFTQDDQKIIYCDGNADFNVELIATGSGTMTYSVEAVNLLTGEVSESKTFTDVSLEIGKTMHSPVADISSLDEIKLFVTDSNYSDLNVYTHEVSTNGAETAVQHVWGSGEITIEASHTDFGEIRYYCQNCDATRYEQIEKLPEHTFNSLIDLTEISHGIACSCGETRIENHTFGEWTVIKEATKSEMGLRERTCVCGRCTTEEIPKLKDSDAKPANRGGSASIIIIAASVALVSLGAIFIVIKKRKNKNP